MDDFQEQCKTVSHMIVVVFTIFFSKQCKLLYKSIIFLLLDLGFVISGTVMFSAVNPYLDLPVYIAYSIHYKPPSNSYLYSVYFIFQTAVFLFGIQ